MHPLFPPLTGSFYAPARGTPLMLMFRHIEVERHIALSRFKACWN